MRNTDPHPWKITITCRHRDGFVHTRALDAEYVEFVRGDYVPVVRCESAK